MGQRRNRAVALVTDDFRVYHDLAPFLESNGIRVVGLRPGEPIPASTQVLVGGPVGDARSLPLHPHRETTLLAILAALDDRPTARNGYKRVIFGVDPGQVIGLAVLADGAPLYVAEERASHAAVQRVASWAQGLTANAWEVHVGNGHPQVGRGMLQEFRRHLPAARILLVPEQDTTPHRPITQSRHTDAAIAIAMREPVHQ